MAESTQKEGSAQRPNTHLDHADHHRVSNAIPMITSASKHNARWFVPRLARTAGNPPAFKPSARSLGKGLHTHDRQQSKPQTTADSMVNAFKRETQRQRSLVRKANVCDAHLMFITTAFRRLTIDEDFTNLLLAEKLDTMAAFLAEVIGLKRRVA